MVAVAVTVWLDKSGRTMDDAVSLSASGLATFVLATIALTMLANVISLAYQKLRPRFDRFLTLDWMVPVAAAVGLVIAYKIWQ